MASIPSRDYVELARLFGVRQESESLGGSGAAKFYRMQVEGLKAYVVHSPEGVELASMPEIVGEEMASRARRAARHAVKLMEELGLEERAILLHVLRGSPGYELSGALEEAAEVDNIYIRVKYDEDSYRDHREREARAIYTKAGPLGDGRYTLIVADTVATGRSMIEALERGLQVLRFKGITLTAVYIYGFISLPGARRVAEALRGQGVEPVFIAVENLSALSSNMYDMPLYGPDPADPDILLGSAAPPEAFRAMLPHYYPGMDQPGDWSERQCLLFNGIGYERGDVAGHLRRSLEMLEELHKASSGRDWYRGWMEDIYHERRHGLEEALSIDPCKAAIPGA